MRTSWAAAACAMLMACGGRSALESGDAPNDIGAGGSAVATSGAGPATGSTGGGGAGGGAGGADACTKDGQPILLASAQMGPRRMVIDDDTAYWSDHDIHSGRVMSVPLAGGAPVELASGETRPRGIAVDDTHVYWTDSLDGSVQRVPKLGGDIEQLGPWQHNPTAIDISDAGVYWVNRSTGNGGQIMRWAQGAEPVEEVSGLDEPMLVAVDDASIWWLTASSGAGDGTLQARYIDGGATALWGYVDTPRALEVDDTYVFIGIAGDIISTRKDSGPFTTVVADTVARGMASHDGHLYWADSNAGIGRVTRDGDDATWIVDTERARDVAVDDRCVYWVVGASAQETHNGEVWKTAR